MDTSKEIVGTELVVVIHLYLERLIVAYPRAITSLLSKPPSTSAGANTQHHYHWSDCTIARGHLRWVQVPGGRCRDRVSFHFGESVFLTVLVLRGLTPATWMTAKGSDVPPLSAATRPCASTATTLSSRFGGGGPGGLSSSNSTQTRILTSPVAVPSFLFSPLRGHHSSNRLPATDRHHRDSPPSASPLGPPTAER